MVSLETWKITNVKAFEDAQEKLPWVVSARSESRSTFLGEHFLKPAMTQEHLLWAIAFLKWGRMQWLNISNEIKDNEFFYSIRKLSMLALNSACYHWTLAEEAPIGLAQDGLSGKARALLWGSWTNTREDYEHSISTSETYVELAGCYAEDDDNYARIEFICFFSFPTH
ncbi:hypothetical protein D9757_010206 [Collybiopsis confluens]|uniref:Uncharacterized protein n=1 Tax=Collybiopsis confluens TaxID=2823264 RepID=A0A8H5LTD1_9AGAR|nr:hypothetical protein D9757_010206 [Collybiopsis confluens]